ncbi:protein FAM221A isoform 2-T2 [Mantella aurantiaca]
MYSPGSFRVSCLPGSSTCLPSWRGCTSRGLLGPSMSTWSTGELLVKMMEENFLPQKNMRNTRKQYFQVECKTDYLSAGGHQPEWTVSLWDQRLHAFAHTGSGCAGFHSSFTCGCSQPAFAHDTVVETKEERLAQGKPVGQDVPYAAMGGLTGFSSLAEGYMRLDESGIGAPDRTFLEAAEDFGSHPFLRAYGPSSSTVAGPPSADNQVSSVVRTEEDDMSFFEKRYQERLQKEKEQKRQNSRRPNIQRP